MWTCNYCDETTDEPAFSTQSAFRTLIYFAGPCGESSTSLEAT